MDGQSEGFQKDLLSDDNSAPGTGTKLSVCARSTTAITAFGTATLVFSIASAVNLTWCVLGKTVDVYDACGINGNETAITSNIYPFNLTCDVAGIPLAGSFVLYNLLRSIARHNFRQKCTAKDVYSSILFGLGYMGFLTGATINDLVKLPNGTDGGVAWTDIIPSSCMLSAISLVTINLCCNRPVPKGKRHIPATTLGGFAAKNLLRLCGAFADKCSTGGLGIGVAGVAALGGVITGLGMNLWARCTGGGPRADDPARGV